MSAEKEEITIILVKNYWSGYLHSMAWIAALTAGIVISIWLESTAMQWIFAILWFLSLIGWASGERKKMRRTPEQAMKEIQNIIDR